MRVTHNCQAIPYKIAAVVREGERMETPLTLS